ncbi:MAG: hypothetical protein AAFY03_10425, partial [Pseudomonadota bacterium]
GAVLLKYSETQGITIDFESIQYSLPYQNAVFSAIDGDLSLFVDTNFLEPVGVAHVPVPQSASLLIAGILCFAAVRRRQRAR